MQDAGLLIGEALGSILDWLGFINLTPISNAFEVMEPYITAVCYFLPMQQISLMFGVIIAFFGFTLIIRIVKLVWELIPVL